MTVELAVLTPIIVLFALLAVALGRYELARIQVADAARAAADAASVVSSAADASAAASASAMPALAGEAHVCPLPIVSTDTSSFRPDVTTGSPGSVSVTVQCTVSMSDLMVPGVPGSITVRSTGVAPVDPFRVVG
ncbi:MAG: TadE/TadG family type IV pilus assembly protein [Acidimicrobiales bacterium]